MLVLSPLMAFAYKPPAEPPLPNFDQRLTAHVSRTKAAIPARDAALGQLRGRVPDVQIEFDEVIETPRWIASPRGFLTGPDAQGRAVTPQRAQGSALTDPHRAVKAFIEEHRALFGHGAEALGAARLTRDDVTAHNGLRTVAWQQRVDGIPVLDGLLIGHITKKGELVSLSSRFLPDLDRAANAAAPKGVAQRAVPTIPAEVAVALAARNLGEDQAAGAVAALGPVPQNAE
jgi:hypothetical protein